MALSESLTGVKLQGCKEKFAKCHSETQSTQSHIKITALADKSQMNCSHF